MTEANWMSDPTPMPDSIAVRIEEAAEEEGWMGSQPRSGWKSARPGNWGRELDPLRHWDHGAPPGCSTGDGGRVRAVEPVLPEWLAPAAQAGLRRSGPAWWRC